MPPETFRQSGLTKLSPKELESLNAWLLSSIPIIALHIPTPQASNGGSVLESRIDGEFHGWDGDTIYKLQNGQVWQQAAYHYHYHFAYSPEVTIYPSRGSLVMKVDGDDDEPTPVRQLR
jgi:hypothetical protein